MATEHKNPAGSTEEAVKTAGTWKLMVDSNQALLLRKTGHDVHWWAARGREEGLKNDAELRDWMRDQHGITGYAQYAVSWEMFGYPEFMLRDADELLDGQYAKHPALRPIADAVLAWAAATEGVQIQLRKGYVSLHTARRKFAQLTRSNNTTVDLTLRLVAEPDERLEAIKVRADDLFDRRIRLKSTDDVDPYVLSTLARAVEQNS
ncbi:DUF5655 domain-containing protein [Pseudarthrobacter sp. J75]|uniref:DUF5655 domain-containing protein n=1 Tax=unclassified Pseudarthrobacter TaxID=2647000 RepID=UPI002E7FFF50|nr:MULTISPECIES: DUF5655 domain-containing protein [unclassified Pseudarthrobacter]MEE2524137.1 DUF5655 domain-containing protein [Pseudarthrobacter sp. J47]MEE2530416.1 DUF5655 domain-containing protein [Pseudarthrobacter sp. J75]